MAGLLTLGRGRLSKASTSKLLGLAERNMALKPNYYQQFKASQKKYVAPAVKITQQGKTVAKSKTKVATNQPTVRTVQPQPVKPTTNRPVTGVRNALANSAARRSAIATRRIETKAAVKKQKIKSAAEVEVAKLKAQGAKAPSALQKTSMGRTIATGLASVGGTIAALVGAQIVMDNLSREDTTPIIKDEDQFNEIWKALQELQEHQNEWSNIDWSKYGAEGYTSAQGNGFINGGYTYMDPNYPTGVDWIDDTIAKGGALVLDEYGDPYAVMNSDGTLTGLTEQEEQTVNRNLNINPLLLIGTAGTAMLIGYAAWKNREKIKKAVTGGISKVPFMPNQRRAFI